ncbi:hypothetical protein GLAREA_07825 [Glarea lozoyensis ATCC 20868]|uniref:Uncharacterized protein n=1 Tax=Glarea lozoyensis (strain ATCC 20868 / MF5171) TaxID=1116229 RepID=S3DKV6_GLAL2|nr:uncharacterized protein GLAREA_07825 [Glarea lozoyensis ATCC 20868]EPE32691.1 hypothetical protein GLAREA_07825 [Glarea lozoyensis ATCC 20868]
MTFQDAEGKECSIHIPLERYDEAMDYFIKENWEELKKFEEWNGQEYKDHEIRVTECYCGKCVVG